MKKTSRKPFHFDGDRNTYRMAYTSFKKAVYGLHVFKKKSKRGNETPKRNRDLADSRYLLAEAHYAKTYGAD